MFSPPRLVFLDIAPDDHAQPGGDADRCPGHRCDERGRMCIPENHRQADEHVGPQHIDDPEHPLPPAGHLNIPGRWRRRWQRRRSSHQPRRAIDLPPCAPVHHWGPCSVSCHVSFFPPHIVIIGSDDIVIIGSDELSHIMMGHDMITMSARIPSIGNLRHRISSPAHDEL